VTDVAAKLRMGASQIEALERADYAMLPSGTFLRGFVRSYAKLLNCDAQPLLSLLEKTHAAADKPAIVVPSHNIKYTAPGERFATPRARAALAAVILLALALGGWYWWMFVRPAQLVAGKSAQVNAVEVPAPGTESVTVNLPAPAASSVPAELETPVRTAAMPEPAAAITRVADTVPAKPAKPASLAESSLHFTFAGDSWVEVVDSSGKTLVSHRYRIGEEEDVSGKGPLSIVIGNAPSTRMTYNGSAFDLAPHTRVAVARFTLK